MRADVNFHIHTRYSDGSKDVAEIVAGLKDAGVRCFSITDHDCVKGNEEASALAKQYGLTHINGVEFSCCFDGEIGFDATYVCHIIGLDIDTDRMQICLDKIAAAKEEKVVALFNELIRDGYKLNAKNVYNDGMIKERRIIGREIVNAGYAKDLDEAFGKILNSGKYHGYANNIPTIKESIGMIHDCGGIAVWAHPFGVTRGGKRALTKEQVARLSESMLSYGIDAVEVYYQEYSAEKIKFLEELAKGMKLPASVATDYHGIGQREQLSFHVDGIIPKASTCGIIRSR
jgi:predicted metal-dependent phosphoesterase TrpH